MNGNARGKSRGHDGSVSHASLGVGAVGACVMSRLVRGGVVGCPRARSNDMRGKSGAGSCDK